MPLTDSACPECGGLLHTDDLIEGECVTPGCGAEFPPGLGERDDLPDWELEASGRRDIPDTDNLKSVIRDMLEDISNYQGDPIDDYWEYHPAEYEPYHDIFGSLVYAMTPIGDTYVFQIHERQPEDADGYRVKLIADYEVSSND